MPLRYFCLLLGIWLAPTMLTAQETIPTFKHVADGSSLGFNVLWNGSPLQGQFDHFDINIAFHPDKLSQSSVEATIYLESLAVDNNDVKTTLPQQEWLNSATFPQALFQATQFERLDEHRYVAKGTLTLKGHTLPLSLHFTLEDFSPTRARINGAAQIARKAFGIGWENTDAVDNLVNITVTLNALP